MYSKSKTRDVEPETKMSRRGTISSEPEPDPKLAYFSGASQEQSKTFSLQVVPF